MNDAKATAQNRNERRRFLVWRLALRISGSTLNTFDEPPQQRDTAVRHITFGTSTRDADLSSARNGAGVYAYHFEWDLSSRTRFFRCLSPPGLFLCGLAFADCVPDRAGRLVSAAKLCLRFTLPELPRLSDGRSLSR